MTAYEANVSQHTEIPEPCLAWKARLALIIATGFMKTLHSYKLYLLPYLYL